MSNLVRLLGFSTLNCGCLTGKYREVSTERELVYVEEKGDGCGHHGHRRNHAIAAGDVTHGFSTASAQAAIGA